MIIKDKETKKVFYNTGKGKEFFVAVEFWKLLKAGKVTYRTGREKKGKGNKHIFYTELISLNLKDEDFEKKFEEVAGIRTEF